MILVYLKLIFKLIHFTRKLLQILLVGQPELKAKLALPQLRQLKQRVGLRCSIRPLTPEETKEYIRSRLRIAGAGGKEQQQCRRGGNAIDFAAYAPIRRASASTWSDSPGGERRLRERRFAPGFAIGCCARRADTPRPMGPTRAAFAASKRWGL